MCTIHPLTIDPMYYRSPALYIFLAKIRSPDIDRIGQLSIIDMAIVFSAVARLPKESSQQVGVIGKVLVIFEQTLVQGR